MPRRIQLKSTVLLGTLILLILLYPFFEGDTWARRFLAATTLWIIIGGLWELKNDRRWFLPAIVLAVPTGIASLFQFGSERHPMLLPSLEIPLFALLASNLVVYTLRPGTITIDKLAAAISGYLMLAFTWASIYRLLDVVTPGSFAALNDRDLSIFDHLYFSVVTLTTLGYGDITPVTDRARSFVMLEAVVGTLYTVVLISRLVSTFGDESQRMNGTGPKSKGSTPS